MPLQKDYNPNDLSDQEPAEKNPGHQFHVCKVMDPLDGSLPISILEDDVDGPLSKFIW